MLHKNILNMVNLFQFIININLLNNIYGGYAYITIKFFNLLFIFNNENNLLLFRIYDFC